MITRESDHSQRLSDIAGQGRRLSFLEFSGHGISQGALLALLRPCPHHGIEDGARHREDQAFPYAACGFEHHLFLVLVTFAILCLTVEYPVGAGGRFRVSFVTSVLQGCLCSYCGSSVGPLKTV